MGLELPDKQYQIIYADPPWNIDGNLKETKRGMDGYELPYDSMPDSDIIELPVKNICDTNAVLFMWVVDSKIPIMPDIMNSWGFKYKCLVFIWYKKARTTSGSNAPYPNFTRRSCEYCFLGTRGSIKPISRKIEQFHSISKSKHSEKPSIFKDEIVKLYGDLQRIELFARVLTLGWDNWGNQAPTEYEQTIEEHAIDEWI